MSKYKQAQPALPEQVTELIEDVRQDLEVVFYEIAKGNIK